MTTPSCATDHDRDGKCVRGQDTQSLEARPAGRRRKQSADERLARHRAACNRWYAHNREKCTAQRKRWRERNREKINALHRLWSARNREKCRATYARWYLTNPEKVKANAHLQRSRRGVKSITRKLFHLMDPNTVPDILKKLCKST